jgi:hypothetical protein
MSYRPGSHTYDLRATYFSLARRWTIQSDQAIYGLELLS